MSDSESTDSTDVTRESHLVGCSVRGPDHEQSGKPCQDAWDGIQLPDSRFVLAVADGLGSAEHSHVGSEVATETIVSKMKEVVRNEDFTESSLENEFKIAFESVRSAIQDEADRQGVAVSELNTTLLAAAGGPSGVGAAAVGDGGIICVYDGDFELMVPREDAKYANRTTPVQSDNWKESYRFRYSDNVDGVAAFSDGLENIAWDGKVSPQDSLFDQFFNLVWNSTDVNRIKKELEDFLDHERYRDISGDDKTIAIATLNIDYGNRNISGATEPDSKSQPRNKSKTETNKTRDSKSDQITASSSDPSSTAKDLIDGAEGETASTGTASNITDNDSEATGSYEGEVVKVNGETLYLKKKYGTDQTGVFYSSTDENYPVVKIFDEEWCNNEQKNKLIAMIDKSPHTSKRTWEKNTIFQWPSSLVTDYSGNTFLGCTFDQQVPTRSRSINKYAHTHERNQSLGARLGSLLMDLATVSTNPGSSRFNTAIDLAAAVSALHKQNIAVTNFDPRGIFVTETSLWFSSCDRFALDDGSTFYPGARGHAQYKSEFDSDGSLQEAQYGDRLGLAIHIYALLLQGDYPFTILEQRETDERNLVRDQLKPHITRNVGSSSLRASDEERAYTELPRDLRNLFQKCFIEGFNSPAERPSAEEWVKVLAGELR